MSTLSSICVHIALDACLGLSLVTLWPHNHKRNLAETLVAAILLGFYAETLIIFTLMFIGISFETSGRLIICAIPFIAFVAFIRARKTIHFTPPRIKPLRWYEWLMCISLSEKILFALWELGRTAVWTEDTMTHWSGRGRCLFGKVNWSLDPASPVFLGYTSYAKNYPLGTPIWRATTALLNNGWNDILARADSLLFFIILVASVWLIVYRFSKGRYLAAIAAFIVIALPLRVWHTASGYNDITVEAFVVAALAAVFRREWFLAGVFMAGAGWMKNEGLVVYGSAFLGAAIISSLLGLVSGKPAQNQKENWKNIAAYLLGTLSLTPYLIFKQICHLGFSSAGATRNESFGLSLRPGAIEMLFNTVVTGPTHSIFWLCVLPSIILLSATLFRDKLGRILLFFLVFVICELSFIYCATNAFIYLENQTAPNRSMLQVSSLAVITVIYGVWLKIKSPVSNDVSALHT
jgi:hypothetical protein